MTPRRMRHTAARVWSGRKIPQKRLVIAAGLLLSGGILAYLILNHLGPLVKVGERIEWAWVGAAAACSLGSYLMVGLALEELLALLGFALPFAEVLGIALVSTTANYFVSSAGISGFALKAHLLRKRRVPYGTTVTASVLSSAVMYIVLAVIIGEGLLYLMVNLQGTRIAVMESALGLLLLLAVSVPPIVFFFDHELRGRVALRLFHWLNHAVYWFSKSEIPREDFHEFERQLTEGLDQVRRHHARLTKTVAYTCVDWGLAMTSLYLCFRAVGVGLSVGHLSAGFSVGQAATLIPILPGGLGAVEGSMAAVYEALGVDWNKALVAVLLYRLVYYLLPAALSVFVLWGLKVSEPELIEETARESGRLEGFKPPSQ